MTASTDTTSADLPSTFWAFGPDAITLTDGCGLCWSLPWGELAAAVAGPSSSDQGVTVHQLAGGRCAVMVGPIGGPTVIAKFGRGELERFVMARSEVQRAADDTRGEGREAELRRGDAGQSWTGVAKAFYFAVFEDRLDDASRVLAMLVADESGRRAFVEAVHAGVAQARRELPEVESILREVAAANGIEIPPLDDAEPEVLH